MAAVAPASGQYVGYYPKGSITTKDGVTVTGATWLAYKNPYYIVQPENNRRRVVILIRNIRKLRLFPDTNNVCIDLIRVQWGSHGFWRLRRGTDSAGVVDDGFEDWDGSRMYLFHGRYRQKIYGWWAYHKAHRNVEPILRAFIQKYYPTDKLLAEETAMIKYLSGRAVELRR